MSLTAEVLISRARNYRLLPSPSRCRKIRKRAGRTAEEVAQVVGVTPVTVLRWEKGESHPRGEARGRYTDLITQLEEVV